MSREFYTYVLRDLQSGEPIYVGKGHGARAYKHGRKHAKSPLTQKIQKMMRLEGYPAVQIIKAESEQDAFEMEKLLIDFCGRKDLGTGPLLNLMEGGQGGCHGPETCEKIRQSKLGKPLSEEWKRAVSVGLTGRKLSAETRVLLCSQRQNRHWSEETKAKISASNMGRVLSEEHKAKISVTMQGRTLSEAHKQAMSAAMIGKRISEESKAKISVANKGRRRPDVAGVPRTAEVKAKIAAGQEARWARQRAESLINSSQHITDESLRK